MLPDGCSVDARVCVSVKPRRSFACGYTVKRVGAGRARTRADTREHAVVAAVTALTIIANHRAVVSMQSQLRLLLPDGGGGRGGGDRCSASPRNHVPAFRRSGVPALRPERPPLRARVIIATATATATAAATSAKACERNRNTRRRRSGNVWRRCTVRKRSASGASSRAPARNVARGLAERAPRRRQRKAASRRVEWSCRQEHRRR